MKAWRGAAWVVLGLMAFPAMARDLYLTSGTQNERAYLDVQSIQDRTQEGQAVRVFQAEIYRLKPVGKVPSGMAWVLAANCAVPHQVARVEEITYDDRGQESSRMRFAPAGLPFVFEDHTVTSLFGDFWLAACKGEGMQVSQHRMFARTPAEVLATLRRPAPPAPKSTK